MEYIRSIYPFVLEAGSLDKTSDLAWNIGMGIVSFFLLEGAMLMVYFSIFHILRANQSKVPRTTESSNRREIPKKAPKKVMAKAIEKKEASKVKATPTKKTQVSPPEKAPNKPKTPAKKKPIAKKVAKVK